MHNKLVLTYLCHIIYEFVHKEKYKDRSRAEVYVAARVPRDGHLHKLPVGV